MISTMEWLLALVIAALPIQAAAHYPTAEQTRAEFESVCARLLAGDDPIFGRAPIEALEKRVSHADRAEEAILQDLSLLGFAYIRVGRLEEAERAITRARDIYRNLGLEAPKLWAYLSTMAGIVSLNLAEQRNCLTLTGEGACVLPVRPSAVHSEPALARQAGDRFLEALARQPEDIAARWLLNISRMLSGDYPDLVPPALQLPADRLTSEPIDKSLGSWMDVSTRLGVETLDLAGGAVVDDFDGDGLLDLVSTSWGPCDPMRAFRNLGPDGFEDVTTAWGLDAQLGGLNLTHADFDNDGDLDLLVLRGAWLGTEGRIRNSLLRNDLDGEAARFVDVSVAAGIAYPAYPTQAGAWGDYDNDGDLDLYVANEADDIVIDPSLANNTIREGHPAQLFRNNGNGTFTDVARTAGVRDRGFAKGAAWGDYDNDGDLDLYVSNLGPNVLFRNDGNGRFTDVTSEVGGQGQDRRTFSTWFFDFDHDGDLDLFAASYNVPADVIAAHYLGVELIAEGWETRSDRTLSNPILFRNDDGRLTDASAELGLKQPVLTMGANYGDIDGDGYLDLYLGTGMPDFAALNPNVLFINQDGAHFSDQTFATGLGHLQKGHAVAFGDLDFDGDEDLYQQLGGAFPYDRYRNALYLNPNDDPERRWLVLRLRGSPSNRFAVGARVRIEVEDATGQMRRLERVVSSGSSFGGSSLQLEVGLGTARAIRSVAVAWPGQAPGAAKVLSGFELDRYYLVEEGAEKPVLIPTESFRYQLGRQRMHHHEEP